jgi:hypothetical protein
MVDQLNPLPPIEADTDIFFKEESFRICSPLFKIFSRQYGRIRRSEVKLQIREEVNRNSVQQFLNGCQLRSYQFTRETVFDILLLCHDWDVRSLASSANEFISKPENCLNLLIDNIQHYLRIGCDTSDLESVLRADLMTFINDDSLLSLPFPLLSRILDGLSIPDESFRGFFRFLLRCLDRFGSSASSLFKHLDLRRLTADEFDTLHCRTDFVWFFVSKTFTSFTISQILSAHREQSEVFIRERKELQSIIQSQNERIELLLSEIVSLRTQMENITAIKVLSHETQIAETLTEIKSLRLEVTNSESERRGLKEDLSELRRFAYSLGSMPSDSTEFMVLVRVDDELQAIAVNPDPAKNPNPTYPANLSLELVAPNSSDNRQHFMIDGDPQRNVIIPACAKTLAWDWGCGQVFCHETHRHSNQRFVYDGSHFICLSHFGVDLVTKARKLVPDKPSNLPNHFIIVVRGSPLWQSLEKRNPT